MLTEKEKIVIEGMAYLNQRVWLLEGNSTDVSTDTIGHAALHTCLDRILIGSNDEETIETLKSLRETYITPKTKDQTGKEFKEI